MTSPMEITSLIYPDNVVLRVFHGDKGVCVKILRGERARDAAEKVLNESSIPSGDIAWAFGLQRVSELLGAKGETVKAARILLTLFSLACDGKPVLWQCPRRHVRPLERFVRGCHGLKLEILRGSLRDGNSAQYSHLMYTMDDGTVAYDDHVLCLYVR